MSAVQSHYQAQWGNAAQCFPPDPVVDLRTPASTFEASLRPVRPVKSRLSGKPSILVYKQR